MMRILSIIIIALIISPNGYSQYGILIFSDTIDIETNHNWISLDTTLNDNIWKIGTPSKSYFDSAYTVPNAIATDLINTYPVNNNSYFDIVIECETQSWWEWGEGIISFWHKFDTDTLSDGGYITVSYDGGLNWFNIIHDDNNIETSSINFYNHTDTIAGGIPAFTGFSNGWVYSEFYWFWDAIIKDLPVDSLILRINFQSDSNNTNKAGWMIDHFRFNGYELFGSVEEDMNSSQIEIYPIPANDYLIIDFNNNGEFVFELYDCLGKLVFRKDNIKVNSFRVGDINLKTGIYLYSLFSSESHYMGKIIIE